MLRRRPEIGFAVVALSVAAAVNVVRGRGSGVRAVVSRTR